MCVGNCLVMNVFCGLYIIVWIMRLIVMVVMIVVGCVELSSVKNMNVYMMLVSVLVRYMGWWLKWFDNVLKNGIVSVL